MNEKELYRKELLAANPGLSIAGLKGDKFSSEKFYKVGPALQHKIS
jgi:hypothetical protein